MSIAHPIAFVTCTQLPDLTPDERTVIAPLMQRGCTVTPIRWDDPSAAWADYAAILMRSPWDYFTRYEEFMAWLATMDGLPVWNPVTVIRWNSHKNYLAELASKGIAIVQTITVPKGMQRSLEGIVRDYGWKRAVVKPSIAGGAYKTWITEPQHARDDQGEFEALLKQSDVMIQPFISEVATVGEYSLIFFNKRFSHAVLKKPRAGDFRVQERHGGSTVSVQPSRTMIEQAQQIVNLVESPLLYARVDGVDLKGTFTLMELEVFEPALFLLTDQGAPERFADAILTLF